jgi:DNA-binding IclR family transcriptional regulator
MARANHQSAQRYPLTSILGTDAGVRLARELARHGGELSAPDLVRRTGLAKASVARGLEALV